MRKTRHIVIPEAIARDFWGYISAAIANGSVRNPYVPVEIKMNRNTAGSQFMIPSLSLVEKTAHNVIPIKLKSIPTPDAIAIGFLPNLIEEITDRTVAAHFITPMITVHKKASNTTPASMEN